MTQAEDNKEKLEKALSEIEQPKMNWKVIGQIALVFVVLWVLAGMAEPYIGIWGFVVVGIVTAIALGFAIYVWRLMRKSSGLMNILKGATDAEGRRDAIAQLDAKGDDAMAQMAKAQLVAQEDPKEAMRILESIDLDKAPKVVQTDVRAQLGMMYLMKNRVKDARKLADDMEINPQAGEKQQAMYAAVMCEAFARSGETDRAERILKDYDPQNASYEDMRALLYRAHIYLAMKQKNKGRARTYMMHLARLDINQLGAFVQEGANPQMKKLAMEAIRKVRKADGESPLQKVHYRRY